MQSRSHGEWFVLAITLAFHQRNLFPVGAVEDCWVTSTVSTLQLLQQHHEYLTVFSNLELQLDLGFPDFRHFGVQSRK
jgi:hypothetical protein